MTDIDPRMAAFDAVMFGVEHDPVLRSTIVALIVLDSEPDVDVGTARVERMTRLVPKLRQVVSGTTASLLPPRWEWRVPRRVTTTRSPRRSHSGSEIT